MDTIIYIPLISKLVAAYGTGLVSEVGTDQSLV